MFTWCGERNIDYLVRRLLLRSAQGEVTISSAATTAGPSGFFAKAYSAFGVILLLELCAQFYFIAAAVIPIAAPLTLAFPSDQTSYNTFSVLHGLNGTFLVPFTIVVLVLIAFAARHPWKTTLLTALLLFLVILQFVLTLGFQHPELAPVAGLHGLNALVIVGLALRLTWQRWAF
jgi:hypothetical protein